MQQEREVVIITYVLLTLWVCVTWHTSVVDTINQYHKIRMIYSSLDAKNLVSFGVVSPDGITDVTVSIIFVV